MMYDFHSCSSSFLAQSIIHLRKYLVDRRPLIRQHLREPAKLRERSLRYIRRWSSEGGKSSQDACAVVRKTHFHAL